jgi:hypothetical protein
MAYKYDFHCIDNGGKRQHFTVTANNQHEAVRKAMIRANKHAKGDIGFSWECKLAAINFMR